MEALCNQSFHDFETIVVVDGSNDNTLELLAGYHERLRNLKVHVQVNKGRAGARNAGAHLASADLLIFIDDDIEVQSGNIARHVEFQSTNAGEILVGNPILNAEKIRGDKFLLYRQQVERSWTVGFNARLNEVTFNSFYFTTQNVSIPRLLFLECGLFDERLKDSEDFDFCVRALLKGANVFFEPGLTVFHNDFPDLRQTVKRQRQYYTAKHELLQLHPEYASIMPAYFEWRQKSWKDAVRSIVFNSPEFWFSLMAGKIFDRLPASARHVLYSAFIHSQSAHLVRK